MTPEEQTISEILSLEEDKAKIAMIQLYAKQQCIAFVNWINGGGSDGMLTSFKGFWSVSGAKEQDWITTEELYTLFLSTNQ